MTAVLVRSTPEGPRLHVVSNDARMNELSEHLRAARVRHDVVWESDYRTRLIIALPQQPKP